MSATIFARSIIAIIGIMIAVILSNGGGLGIVLSGALVALLLIR
jgi:hypothetical protein